METEASPPMPRPAARLAEASTPGPANCEGLVALEIPNCEPARNPAPFVEAVNHPYVPTPETAAGAANVSTYPAAPLGLTAICAETLP